MSVKISSIEAGSIAQKKGFEPGDTLVSINGNNIKDVLDYRFYLNDTKLKIEVVKYNGKSKTYKIHKGEYDDIGLEFETYLMDKQHTCKNKCIFCFVDQLPKGLRDSLYFKDDDDRLSFLFGNYVTLTNIDEEEVDRLIKLHISPINLSIHTMNPDLRVKMMKNPRSGEVLEYIKKFANAGISINAQLVLCPGINDGEELVYSLKELFKYYPAMRSVACVPVGLSKHRENLEKLELYTPEKAREVIAIVDKLNAEFMAKEGTKIAYASDEFYILAEEEMPDIDYYDDFPQLENGVGMWALLKEEFTQALKDFDICEINRKVTIATGIAAYPLMVQLAKMAMDKIKGLEVNVEPIKNKLFGESITVSGLITGGDIFYALEGKNLGDELIIPPNCLRNEGDMFLDSMTVEELSEKLKVKIICNESSGEGLLSAITGGD